MAHPAMATAEHLGRKEESKCDQGLVPRAHPPTRAPSTEAGSPRAEAAAVEEHCAISGIQPVLLGILLGTQEPPEVTQPG